MIKEAIQRWLGIDQVLCNLQDIRENRLSDRRLLNRMNEALDTITPGISRVIAKLDTKYAESEFDPARKAESDKIGKEVLKRLKAEQAARAPYNDPPDASGSYSNWKSGAYKP